jgi:hypothetical protein
LNELGDRHGRPFGTRSRRRHLTRCSYPACRQRLKPCSNDRATLDLVGIQSHCCYDAGDDYAVDVLSSKSLPVAAKGRSPVLRLRRPSACTCAYVGNVDAMNKYRASFGALPPDVLSSGGFTDPEQNMINSMENDNAGAQFDNDVFGPDF